MDLKNQLTDEYLLQLINKGGPDEDEAIRALYVQYFDGLCKQVVFNGGRDEDGQDMFQETVIAFLHSVKQGRFRGEASIKTYLYAMNRNIWRNEMRSRDRSSKREKNYEGMERKEDFSGASGLENKQVSQQLVALLENLGENCKQILMQFYYEERSMKEIVAATSYENEQVVRNKKSKCLKKLADMLRERPYLVEQLQTFLNE
jgi:RNA polymerase sigma factor (sigma-70 family)